MRVNSFSNSGKRIACCTLVTQESVGLSFGRHETNSSCVTFLFLSFLLIPNTQNPTLVYFAFFLALKNRSSTTLTTTINRQAKTDSQTSMQARVDEKKFLLLLSFVVLRLTPFLRREH